MTDTITARYILNPHVICNILRLAYTTQGYEDDKENAILQCQYSCMDLVKRLLARLKAEENHYAGTPYATHVTYSQYHIVSGLVYMERIKELNGRFSLENATTLFIIAVYVAGKVIDDYSITLEAYRKIFGCNCLYDVADAERVFLQSIDHNIFLAKEQVIGFL